MTTKAPEATLRLLTPLLLALTLAGCAQAPRTPPQFSGLTPTTASAAALPTPAAILAALPAGEPSGLLDRAVGVPFTMPLGSEFTLGESGLRVRFAAVPEDSRCPADARCIWPGRAVVNVEVAGLGEPQSFTLAIPGDLTPDAPERHVLGPYTLRLLDLAPYPAGPNGSSGPYVVTLVLERS